MGRRGRRKTQGGGLYVHISLIHSTVQQKLTQRCKAIILQQKQVPMSSQANAQIWGTDTRPDSPETASFPRYGLCLHPDADLLSQKVLEKKPHSQVLSFLSSIQGPM